MQTQREIRDTCSGCGACVAACPSHIFEVTERGGRKAAATVASRAKGCMRCGQCMALCPTQSVVVEGLDYERDFFPLAPRQLELEGLERFLESRRSVRVFRDEPVPREMLEKIVRAITLAPPAFTPLKLGISVVARRETIEQGLPWMIETYEKLSSMFRKPISRFFIKRGLTPDSFAALENHVMPLLPERLEGMKAGTWDTITRGAPAMLLFHAAPDAGKAAEDAVIALTYGLLAAHALGLGATAIGLVPPVVERSAKLKALFHIPEENKVYSSMIVGFPRLRFLRGIRRTFRKVDWV